MIAAHHPSNGLPRARSASWLARCDMFWYSPPPIFFGPHMNLSVSALRDFSIYRPLSSSSLFSDIPSSILLCGPRKYYGCTTSIVPGLTISPPPAESVWAPPLLFGRKIFLVLSCLRRIFHNLVCGLSWCTWWRRLGSRPLWLPQWCCFLPILFFSHYLRILLFVFLSPSADGRSVLFFCLPQSVLFCSLFFCRSFPLFASPRAVVICADAAFFSFARCPFLLSRSSSPPSNRLVSLLFSLSFLSLLFSSLGRSLSLSLSVAIAIFPRPPCSLRSAPLPLTP